MNFEIENLFWINDIYKNLDFKSLPHGIIISGPDGIGKRVLANEIITSLLIKKSTTNHKQLIERNNHPDFFLLDRDKINLNHITYRDVWDEDKGTRNINDFLSITPSISDNKVALIVNAQIMNHACQNALLKSLEEPAPNSYVIMLINRPRSLIKTVYSRCQVISIPELSSKKIIQWLESNGISDLNSNIVPSFSSPLSIIKNIQENKDDNFKNFISIMSHFIESKISCSTAIKKMCDLDDTLIMKINFLVEFLKIILKSKLTSENLSGIYNKYNMCKFSNLKISNILNELNDLRFNYYRVSQINENHVLNYFLSEVKASIKI